MKMKWLLVVIAIVAVIVGYSVITVSNGPIAPLGRVAFVKLANPDFYPGHPHSQLLAEYAEVKGSKLPWSVTLEVAPLLKLPGWRCVHH